MLALLTATTSTRVSAREGEAAGTHSSQSEMAVSNEAKGPHSALAMNNTDKHILDFGFGSAFVRFNSSQFRASTRGVPASAAYWLTEHLAFEGQTTSTMGDPKPGPYDAKYFFYGGGVVESRSSGKTRPFLRAMAGGVHLLPQTAHSNNGFAALAGIGADVRLTERIWLRVEADYVRSQLYGVGQNNLQLGITLHYRFIRAETRH